MHEHIKSVLSAANTQTCLNSELRESMRVVAQLAAKTTPIINDETELENVEHSNLIGARLQVLRKAMHAAQIKLAEQENVELSNSHFAARLRQLRLARNITRIQLAEHCGLSQSKLDNYEDAKEEPSFSDINLLSKSLGVLPAYLLFG